jgi:hypothetical protein
MWRGKMTELAYTIAVGVFMGIAWITFLWSLGFLIVDKLIDR